MEREEFEFPLGETCKPEPQAASSAQRRGFVSARPPSPCSPCLPPSVILAKIEGKVKGIGLWRVLDPGNKAFFEVSLRWP